MGEDKLTFTQRRDMVLEHIKRSRDDVRVERATRVSDEAVPRFLQRLNEVKQRSRRSKVVFR